MEAQEQGRSGVEDDASGRSTVVEGPDGPVDAAEGAGRASRGHERCLHHPTRAPVGRCDRCKQPVCLQCAVPVRGRLLGPECLPTELGDPALTQPPEEDRPGSGAALVVAGAAAALIGTAGPWTRTGAGDRLFGAWIPDPRWSTLAAAAATALIATAWWVRLRGRATPAAIACLLGIVVAGASMLAIVFPPTFQVASWGPWMTCLGGTVATLGAFRNLSAERQRTQGV